MKKWITLIGFVLVFLATGCSAVQNLPQPPNTKPKTTATPAYKPEDVVSWVGSRVRQVSESFDPKKPTCYLPNGSVVGINRNMSPNCARVYWDGADSTVSVFYVSDELIAQTVKDGKLTAEQAKNRLYFDCQTPDGNKFKANMILVSQKDGWIVTGPAPCIVVDGSKVSTTDRIFWEIGSNRQDNRLLVRSNGKIWSILESARYRVPDAYNWPYGSKTKVLPGVEVASDGLPIQATDTPEVIPGENTELDLGTVTPTPTAIAPKTTADKQDTQSGGENPLTKIRNFLATLPLLVKIAIPAVLVLYLYLRYRATKRRNGGQND